jgi:hypothetical protein
VHVVKIESKVLYRSTDHNFQNRFEIESHKCLKERSKTKSLNLLGHQTDEKRAMGDATGFEFFVSFVWI